MSGLLERVTGPRAVVLSALAAAVVFVGSYRNGWALDDEPIIDRNERSHSVAAAAGAFFSPYWPAIEGLEAGQYRPLVILSFGIDWQVSGGSAAWIHVVNVALHAAATALFVVLVLAWLPPVGSAVAGLLFAVHPVHVEAVANGVGRAEMMAAIGLLAAMLCARRYRRARTPGRRTGWTVACLASLGLGLLSKEHAVVGIALIAVDEWFDTTRDFKHSAPLYVAVVWLTVAWFYLWRGVAGAYVSLSEAAAVRDMSLLERLATMFPAQLHVVRLLTFPFDLAADYNPQVIPRRTEWSLLATIGLLNTTAILALTALSVRRAGPVVIGVLIAVITYSPTSNLLFASGVVLAERNLYMAAAATALAVGWICHQPAASRHGRWVALGIAALLASYAVTTINRIPSWRDTASVVIEDFATHSENYRARLRLASFLRQADDISGALAETMTSGAIFPEDPFVAMSSVPRALELGYLDIAVAEARRAHALRPDHPAIARLYVRSWLARGQVDSAIAVARTSMERAPRSSMAAETYREVLDSLVAPDWQRALGVAREQWLAGRLGAATRTLDSATRVLASASPQPLEHCWDVEAAIPLAALVSPESERRLARSGAALECDGLLRR